MFTISLNGIIRVNRGDSFSFPVLVNIGNNLIKDVYMLNESDALYVGVMEANQPFECALIKKKYTKESQDENGNITVKFIADDTLHVLPGKYYYQIKLVRSGLEKEVSTIVDQTQFFIMS